MSTYKDHSVPWMSLDFNMYQRAGDPGGLSACFGLGAAAAGIGVFAAGLFGASLFVDSTVIGLPEGLGLGVLSGIAGAFGGLTAGAAWVACAAGW
ncbi:hypothetical protein [Arthrobacter sp. KNU40]|uniref:hypothetical protein n=1 Tax=Arthrobacter sp. KNU40 TaxID=3447965 RepID=UPI003F5EAF52